MTGNIRNMGNMSPVRFLRWAERSIACAATASGTRAVTCNDVLPRFSSGVVGRLAAPAERPSGSARRPRPQARSALVHPRPQPL